jgi:hypothetical protein
MAEWSFLACMTIDNCNNALAQFSGMGKWKKLRQNLQIILVQTTGAGVDILMQSWDSPIQFYMLIKCIQRLADMTPNHCRNWHSLVMLYDSFWCR